MLRKLDDFLIDNVFQPFMNYLIYQFGMTKKDVLAQSLTALIVFDGADLIFQMWTGTASPFFTVSMGIAIGAIVFYLLVVFPHRSDDPLGVAPQARLTEFAYRLVAVALVIEGMIMLLITPSLRLFVGELGSLALMAFFYFVACTVQPPRTKQAFVWGAQA